jgi:hypothetical protein
MENKVGQTSPDGEEAEGEEEYTYLTVEDGAYEGEEEGIYTLDDGEEHLESDNSQHEDKSLRDDGIFDQSDNSKGNLVSKPNVDEHNQLNPVSKIEKIGSPITGDAKNVVSE